MSSMRSQDAWGGLDDLEAELNEYMKNVEGEKLYETLEIGADELVKLTRSLASPMSRVSKGGYKHMVKSFAYERNIKYKDVAVGWEKYYGRMVENGTLRAKAQSHLVPLWNKNKESIQTKMIKNLGFD